MIFKNLALLVCLGAMLLGAPHAALAQSALAEAESSSGSKVIANILPLIGIGDDVTLKADEGTPVVVSVGGDATVDGTVDNAVVVVGGKLLVRGEVRGDVVVVGGSAELASGAKVRGDMVVVGGEFKRAKDAQIGHPPTVVAAFAGPAIRAGLEWVRYGLCLGRPVVPSLSFVWVIIAAFFAMYCLLAILFKGAIATTVETVDLHPIGSFITGFLVMLVLAPIIGLLIVSTIGLVLLPLLLCGLLILVMIGKVGVYEYIGSLFFKRLRTPGVGALLGLTLGMAVIVGLSAIPLIGFLVWGFISILGLGTLTLTCIRVVHRELTPKPKAPGGGAPPPAFSGPPTPLNSAPEGAAPPINPGVSPPGAASQSSFAAASAASPAAGSFSTGAPPLISQRAVGWPLADFWPRAGSMFLDLIVVSGALAMLNEERLLPAALVAYKIGFLVWRGATPGYIIAGIKCVRTDGQALDWQHAAARTFASLLSYAPCALGFFWAAWDPRCQTWHDRIAGTLVVKVPPAD